MRIALLLISMVFAVNSTASVVLYDSRVLFEADTGAADVGDLPSVSSGVPFSVGPLTFTSAQPSNTVTAINWSTLIDEQYDLAISGPENFNVSSTDLLSAFGFDFHEPTNTTPPGPSFPDNCNTVTCVDSVFEITLLLNNVFVDSVQFARPNDQLTFVGVSSTNQFNEIQVREIIGSSDNEFFGNFTIATAVPAPASIMLLLSGLLLMGLGNRRG